MSVIISYITSTTLELENGLLCEKDIDIFGRDMKNKLWMIECTILASLQCAFVSRIVRNTLRPNVIPRYDKLSRLNTTQSVLKHAIYTFIRQCNWIGQRQLHDQTRNN